MDSENTDSAHNRERAAAIARLIEEVRLNVRGLTNIDYDALIHANPALMPELEQELDKLKRVQEALLPTAEILNLDQAAEALVQELDGPNANDHDLTQSPGSSSMRIESPGSQIGKYKLLQLIGEGGFGSVFMAEQTTPVRRRVAVKIIKLGMDTRQVIARFDAERQALAMMDHPNIARVLDGGATRSGRPYFVMELVTGDPITKYCDDNHLDIRERLALFVQVCHAVQHAHQKGVIHRDLKPGNILVTTQDGQAFARVIDFGIAKATSARLTEKTLFTELRALIGTPEYMSPEQAGGSLDIDTRADIYSLGVLLYELLTGSTPFAGLDLRTAAYGEIERVIRETEPQKPSTRLFTSLQTIGAIATRRRMEPRKLSALVRGELDWIVMKALDKNRSHRYETATGLANDVTGYCSGGAVVAAPPSAAYQFRKFARRYRIPLAMAAIIGILLSAGIFTSTIQALRARRAERTVASQLAEVSAQKSIAEQERNQASAANRRAEATATKLTRQLSDSYVERGISEWDKHEPAKATLWFVKALDLDKSDPAREQLQRLRIGMSFFVSPHPLNITVKADRSKVEGSPGSFGGYVAGSKYDEDRQGRWIREVGTSVVICKPKTREPLTPEMNHGSKLIDFSFCPEKKLIYTLGVDNTIRLWDASTGRQVTEPLKHNSLVIWISISLDGSMMATIEFTEDERRLLRVWDIQSGRLLLPPIQTQDERADFSPDGKRITFIDEKGVHLRNVRTSEDALLPNPPNTKGERGYYYYMNINESGTIWVATNGKGVCIWRPDTGLCVWLEGSLAMHRSCLSSDETEVALAEGDYKVRIWNVATGKIVGGPLQIGGPVNEMVFSRDHQYLMISSGEGYHVWDLATRTSLPPPFGNSLSGRFGLTPDNEFAEIGDVVWSIWYPSLGYSYGRSSVLPLKFTPDGATLISTGPAGYARLLDSKLGVPVAPPVPVPGKSICFSRNAGRYATIVDDPTQPKKASIVQVYDAATRNILSPAIRTPLANEVILSGNGETLLIAGYFFVWIVDAKTGVPLSRRESTFNKGWLSSAVLSDDGRYAAVYSGGRWEGDRISVWDTLSGAPIPLVGSTSDGSTLGFMPASHTLVSQSLGSLATAHAWSIPSGKALPFQMGGWDIAAFSGDGKRVVSSSYEGMARIWDVESGKALTLAFRSIRRPADSFSPDGRWVATVSDENAVQIFEARTGLPVSPHLKHFSSIDRTIFSTDSSNLATSTDQGDVTLFPLVFNSMDLADLAPLSELVASSRVDETGTVVTLSEAEWSARWESLKKRIPDFFRPVADRPDTEVSQRYRGIVEAWVAAAKTEQERKSLAKKLEELCDAESADGQTGETIYLAETALRLDPSLLIARDDLAWAYLRTGQNKPATQLYEQFGGRQLGEKPGDRVFGADALDAIDELRKQGKDDPSFAKIEAIVRPATRRAATQPATTQPASDATTEPTSRSATRPIGQ